jgi:hypothetical protein
MNQYVPVPPGAALAGDRAKVFVSYSRKDAEVAHMLVAALAARGFDAFLDKPGAGAVHHIRLQGIP